MTTEKITRKTAIIASAYFSALLLGELLARKTDNENGTRHDFSTPGADYTHITGVHGIALDKNTEILETKLSPELLPPDYDAMIIEWTGEYLAPGKEYEAYQEWKHRSFGKHLITQAESQNADILITDLPIKIIPAKAIEGLTEISVFLGSFKILENQPMTRMDFIRALGLSWLISTDINQISTRIAHNANNNEFKESASKVRTAQELFNPQKLAVTFRNLAKTAKTIGLEKYYLGLLGRRPHFVMVDGTGHLGLPGFFSWGRKNCLSYLQTIYPDVFKNAILNEPEALYTSLRMNSGESTQLIDSEMQKLFS